MSENYHIITIDKIVHETNSAITLYFKNPNPSQFKYKPGQYVMLKINISGEELHRAYSFTSSPIINETPSLTIKAIEKGKVSNYLNDNLKVGDTLTIKSPEGLFTPDINSEEQHHYILLGAGSGITPLYSISKSVLYGEPKSKVTLLYGNRNRSSIIFYPELDQLNRQFQDRLKIIHCLSQPDPQWNGIQGRLDKDHTLTLLQPILNEDDYPKSYWICGPSEMMKEVQEALTELNIPKKSIYREFFVPTETKKSVLTDGKTKKVTIFLRDEEHHITLDPPSTILQAAMDAGLNPPRSCQAGICGTCKAKLESGEVKMNSHDALTDDDLDNNYILTCQSHPQTDEVVVTYVNR